MKISIFETEPWEARTFDQLTQVHEIRTTSARLTEATAEEHGDAEMLSIFIYSDAGEKVLEKFPQLKMIATRSTGTDHIGMDYCRQRGIVVCNVPVYGDNTVAEHVFALLLTISRRLVEAVNRTRRGDFSPEGLQGFDLYGKTIGIIGTGAIGRHAIRIAGGFGMPVLAFDVKPDADLARELGFRYAALPEVLAQADIVSLHVPATPQTHHLIGRAEFARMKNGVVLINTARGSIVDHQALLEALAQGKVAAAGLDVLPEEPLIREEAELLRSVFSQKHDLQALLTDHILLRLRNVVITPHNAFNTREAVQRILETTRENIEAFAEGRPQNVAR